MKAEVTLPAPVAQAAGAKIVPREVYPEGQAFHTALMMLVILGGVPYSRTPTR